MASGHYCFHFCIDPVQAFISQARRTRDFWAGSFLLSWLSGVAMAATQRLAGEDSIEFPTPPDDYLQWITGAKNGKGGPRQGSIPNRFKARVPADFDGTAIASAVQQAWWELAQKVWDEDIKNRLKNSEELQRVREVWERQHKNFWEITWVLVDEADDNPNLLNRRKSWRHHLPPDEPGVKCMIMEGWQELSGIEGMNQCHNEQRRAFWKGLRASINGGETDLNEKEMLCGLAFVKRRFVRHFGNFHHRLSLNSTENLSIHGWNLKPNMPSVSYMAAVHWLEALVKNSDRAELEALYEAAIAAGSQRDEWDTTISCLEKARRENGLKDEARKFIALDGNLFFDHTLQAPGRYGLKKAETAEFARLLRRFRDAKPEFAKAPLSPFYAVLVMDGDSLGANLGTPGNPAKIAAALADFTESAKDLVYQCNGVLIYAGGDDVLALLPLEDALDCALKLRNRYSQAFQDKAPGIATSLSGAVIYAHVKTALGEVLRQAHTLLDEVAKDGAGRDAIAVRVLKPGGEHLTWAQPWHIAVPEGKATLALKEIADDFAAATQGDDGQRFSGKFFHRMRERFEILADRDEAPSPRRKDIEMATQVLAADYLASHRSNAPHPATVGENTASAPVHDDARRSVGAMALEFIAPLLDQCCPVQRQPELPPAQWQRKAPNADAALLVRFLAQKGVEGR